MRVFLKSTGRWLRFGWILPLALLTLPMCGLDTSGCDPIDCPPDPGCEGDECGPDVPPFEPGVDPEGAIMCDIPRVQGEGEDEPVCANPNEAITGTSLASGAVMLNLGEKDDTFVLDFSPNAVSQCGGWPKKIEYYGTFPDGLAVCLNCGTQIPAVYATPFDACVARCKELITVDGLIPEQGVDLFCTQNVRLSTNFGKDDCYEGYCTTGGTPNSTTFDDPRRYPENLVWVDSVGGTTISGNTVTFDNGIQTGDFVAGAASEQLITTGDAWVEFEAGETGVSHVIGLRNSCDNVVNCPDLDGTLADIPLSLSLNLDGAVNIVQNNAVLAGPFDPYVAGERFRIHVVDHNDGTADLNFSRLLAPCVPDQACAELTFYIHPVGTGPSYPLRVDTTFRELNASLQNVTIMRIK